jgi:hypothetical protein
MADSRVLKLGLTVVFSAALSCLASAQQTVEVSGSVTDPDNLPLPGVTITLTDANTGFTRTLVTAEDGSYIAGALQPGTYNIDVGMPGFASIRQEGYLMSSGAELRQNFQLQLAGVQEVITVTGESPIVEVTANKLGGTLSGKEIEETPANFRNFTALTQLIPGMTPNPAGSSFEGGQVSANGATPWSNVYQMDGSYNNDDRLGGSQGTQVRMVLDIISEYQVLGSQYAAEFGGGGGAIINMVTRSGTNNFSGRAYSYFRDDSLNARDAFLEDDEPKPIQRTFQGGFGVGGPIVQDKAHFYFNYERDNEDLGGIKRFPAEAAPLAVDQIGEFSVRANNFFARGDFQANQDNVISARWVRETADSPGEDFNQSTQTIDQRANESDFDEIFNFSWTSIVGDYGSNVVRVGIIREELGTGNDTFFGDNSQYIGLDGRNQFGIGSANEHPSYSTGIGGNGGGNTSVRSYSIDDTYSYFKPEWGGDHNFKVGGGFSWNRLDPRTEAASGAFVFENDAPYNPADRSTYPSQFNINVWDTNAFPIDFPTISLDTRAYFFVQDKWQVNDKLTLNLGLRFDTQGIVNSKGNDFAPRTGFAYDVKGDGRTVVRGGFGRFTEYTRSRLDIRLQQRGTQVKFPELSVNDPNSPVLNPDMITDSQGNPGVATLSAAGQAELEVLRAELLSGTTFTNEPWVDDPDRAMPYMWAWSLGIAHEIMPDLAVGLDYVGNSQRDQLGLIDINEPRIFGDANSRPGVDVFDPNGDLIPAEARGVNYRRVLQYTTGNGYFDGDYQSIQVSVTKRFSNRFSTRNAYTLQKSNYVGLSYPENRRVWLDDDPRADYGLFEVNRTHVLSMSASYNPIGGLTLAGIFSFSSATPVNETTGEDDNADRDRNDRPIQGLTDAGQPIVSETDGGTAVANGVGGENYAEVNLSIRYNFNFQDSMGLGLYWDIYNLTNNLNGRNPTGNRSSSSFLTVQNANFPRQMQFGLRFSF